jgi:hypothetical protein
MKICESLKSIRPVGKVTCATFHGSQVLPRKSRIKKSGFYAIPDEFWLPVSIKAAKDLILKGICYHIEDDEKIVEEETVAPLVECLFDGFNKNISFYTNFNGSYECISHSFLDIIVLMENNNGVVGLVCIEDEQQP